MSGFQPAITIASAMEKISINEYLLPAFQRRYTWDTEQIEKLFDSIMKGYPINSMLFWCVKKSQASKWNFYQFLRNYREYYTTNIEDNTKKNDFIAVLDGQQRLTSLYLALRSTYEIHKKYAKWEDKEKNFIKCSFYFNLTQSKEPKKNLDVQYEFLWLDNEETKSKTIYEDKDGQKWFLCTSIDDYIDKERKSFKVYEVMMKFGLTQEEFERLELFYQKIYITPSINFYLEEDSDPDKAVDIFTRINSGGTPLSFADILFSFAVANWKNGNFREKADEVLSNLNFNLPIDFILKTCLFLFHKEIRFQITSFNKDFVQSKIEENWDGIVESIYSVDRMLKNFGFDNKTLTSKNVMMPIIYFVYHNNLTDRIVESKEQAKNREKIKLWILRAFACRAFSSSGDTVLASIRRAFTSNITKNFFNEKYLEFPSEAIEKEAGYIRLNDDDIDEKLALRKDNAETFAILSLIYPNLNRELEFDIDHLHSDDICRKNKLKIEQFDSVVNLQFLEKSENRSKKDKLLEDWVEEKCDGNRDKFLKDHLIPDVNLSIDNFEEFYQKRKSLLIEKLKLALGVQK